MHMWTILVGRGTKFVCQFWSRLTGFASFHDGYTFTTLATPTRQALINELDFVENWQELGMHLGLQKHQLCEIKQKYHDSSCRKTEVLDHWLRNAKNPNWTAVFDALCQMGEYMVALKIKTKYIRMYMYLSLSTFSLQSPWTRLLVYYTYM